MDDNFINVGESRCIQVGQLYGTEVEPNPQAGRFYDSNGISPTLDTCGGGNRMPKIVDNISNKLKNTEPLIKVVGNYMPSNHDASRIVDSDGLAPTVKHQQDLVQSEDDICRTIPAGTHGSTPHLLKTIINESPLRIRKLTPKECWRLMRI